MEYQAETVTKNLAENKKINITSLYVTSKSRQGPIVNGKTNIKLMHPTTTTLLLLQLFTAPWTLSGTTWVSRYQKGQTNLDLLE